MICPKCGVKNPDTSQFCHNCNSHLSPPENSPEDNAQTLLMSDMSLNAGDLFAGRYKIIEELGKGGMGRVYKVLDTELGEKVALKLLNTEISQDKEVVTRFRNELKLARKITHKNICRMYDFSYHAGHPYITMEYVSGETLKSTIKRIGKLPVVKSVFLAIQICDGMAEAHNLGILHRDLKPENIMIDNEGNAHIMDFGIARPSKDVGITGKDVIIGTPQYMSPEQTEGQSLDLRSDIYSLGLLLFEMLTGEPPFPGDSPINMILRHRSELPPEPKEKNPLIPAELNFLILKCLAKNREERYQSVSEILSKLRALESAFPSTDPDLPKKDLLSRRPGKNLWKRYSLKGAAGLILALFAVAVLFWVFKNRSESPPGADINTSIHLPAWTNSIAVLPFQNLSTDINQEYFCDGMTEQLISNLAHIKTLRVPARTSIMAYKNEARDVRQIARELGVAYLLEGSVRKSGNRIRITVQLIDAEANAHIWADDYDRQLDDIFAIQDEVSQAIAAALKLELSQETISFMKTPSGDVEAYDLYLKARHIIHEKYLKTHSENDFNDALETARKAVSIDQDYALGYLLMGYLYEVRIIVTGDESIRDIQKRYLEKAYSLNPKLAEACAGIGYIHTLNREYEKAFPFIKRGFEINPNNYTVCHLTGIFYAQLGLNEMAIAFYSRAIDLDKQAFFSLGNRGLCYLNQGDFNNAKKDLEASLNIQASIPVYLRSLALIHIFEANFDQADKLLKRAEQISPEDPITKWHRAVYFAAQGDKEKALSIQKNVAVCSLLGMNQEAITLLSSEHDIYWWLYSYTALKTFPIYKGLWGETRFQDFIENQKILLEQNIRKYSFSEID